jgi:hypothetical protein
MISLDLENLKEAGQSSSPGFFESTILSLFSSSNTSSKEIMDAPIAVPNVRKKGLYWFRDAGLRRLYLLLLIALISSATNGYDGFVTQLKRVSTWKRTDEFLNSSMMNGLQALTYWQDCE